MSKRAVIYTRVSKEEQVEGYSLDAQLEACQHQCNAQGWEIVQIYSDPGISAKDDNRPAFQAMITAAERDHIDVVVVHKLDRFSRSLVDTITYLGRLRDADCGLKSVTEGEFDFTTTQGWIFLTLLAMFAEWYLKNLSQEVKKGLEQRTNRGDFNGRLSWGYTTINILRQNLLNEEYTHEDRLAAQKTITRWQHVGDTTAIPCPFTAPVITWIFETYAAGGISLQLVCDKLNERGYRTTVGNPWQSSPLRGLLKNRMYIGDIRSNGRWLPGKHQPIISMDLFDAVQERLLTNRTIKTAKRADINYKHYPLSGLLVCEICGGPLVGNSSNDYRRYKDTARRKGRVCSRKPTTITAEKLESQVNDFLFAVFALLPEDYVQRVIDRVQSAAGQSDNTAMIARLETQLQRQKNLYTWGDISEQVYINKRNELTAKIKALQHHTTPNDMVDRLDEIERMAHNMGDIIHDIPPEQQEKLYRALFAKLYVDNRSIIAIEPTPVLWHIISSSGLLCSSPLPR